MSVTHATQYGIALLWTGLAWGADATAQFLQVFRSSDVASFLACQRHGDGEFIWSSEIREKLPTCPDCLRLYQEALVMRDEHLMQWGEKE